MKLMIILTSIWTFLVKGYQIFKSVSKLASLRKEIKDAYDESRITLDMALRTTNKIKSFFSEENDGGKSLTVAEVQEAAKLLEELTVQIQKGYTEVMEAKAEIKKVLDSFKSK